MNKHTANIIAMASIFFSCYSCTSSTTIKKSIKKEYLRKIYSREYRVRIPIIFKIDNHLNIPSNSKNYINILLESIEYRRTKRKFDLKNLKNRRSKHTFRKKNYRYTFSLKARIKNISKFKVIINSIRMSIFFRKSSFIIVSKYFLRTEKPIVLPMQDKVINLHSEPYYYHKEKPPSISRIEINEYEHYRDFKIKLNNSSASKKCSFSNKTIDIKFNCKIRTVKIQFEIKNKTKQNICFSRKNIVFHTYFKRYNDLNIMQKSEYLILMRNKKPIKIGRHICIFPQKKYKYTFYPLSSIKYYEPLRLYYKEPIWKAIFYGKLIGFIFIIEHGKGMKNRKYLFDFKIELGSEHRTKLTKKLTK